MESKKYTLLDLFKNNMKVYVLNDRGSETLYRYNIKKNELEYFNNSKKIWEKTLNTFGWLSSRYFTECIELTYTIDDVIKNPDKVFVMKGKDNSLLYKSDGKKMYIFTHTWTQSLLSYNAVIEAEFVEYKEWRE